jgi:hypothetical protein
VNDAVAACVGSSSNLPWALLWQQKQQWPGRSGYCAVLWVTGWAAVQLEQLEDEEVLQHLQQLLLSFPAIPLPTSDTNNISSSSSSVRSETSGLAVRALEGCKVFRSNWGANPYTRGSYSYPGVGEDGRAAGGSSAEALAAPLMATETEGQGSGSSGSSGTSDSPLVCFAGEATSRSYMGTVHGAFGSGVREAYRLLESWGLA